MAGPKDDLRDSRTTEHAQTKPRPFTQSFQRASRKSITLQERMLLLYSEIAKDYPWLLELLRRNENGLTEAEVENLAPEQRDFVRHVLPEIVQRAASEWQAEAPDPEDDLVSGRVPCSLCHTPNRYIYHIVNRLNGNKLNVGSKCIEYFLPDALRSGDDIKQILKQTRQAKRLAQLNKTFPGIKEIVRNWFRTPDTYSVLVPSRLESPYFELGEEVESIYEAYVTKGDRRRIDSLGRLLEKRKTLLDEMEQYASKNASRKYVPNRRIADWLKQRGDRASLETLEALKKDEVITWRTVHRIEEPGFMQFIASELNTHLRTIGVHVEEVDVERRGYVLALPPNTGVRLFCKHQTLLLNYGGLLFGQDPLKPLAVEYIAEHGTLHDTASIEAVIKQIGVYLSRRPIALRSYDLEFDEAVFLEKSSAIYLILRDLRRFAEGFKRFALTTDNDPEEVIGFIRNSCSERLSQEKFKEREELRQTLQRQSRR